MRLPATTVSLLVLISLGLPTLSQAGYNVVDATPVSSYDSTPISIGSTGATPATSGLIYNNVTTFSGQGYEGGGAATTSFGLTTAMFADDITPLVGTAGTAVTGLTFSVANFNAAAVSAGVILTFYNMDGSGGGPGTLIGGLNFNPITFGAGPTVFTFNYNPGTTIFTIPTTGSFWVGEQFVAAAGSSTTAAQLNALGGGLFNPPSVGESQDVFFQASSAGSVATNNPAGGFEFFNGNPVANFGFSFTGTLPNAVPEPSSLVLMGLGGVVMAFGALRKAGIARRRQAA
jgi:PEP-CTERM motif